MTQRTTTKGRKGSEGGTAVRPGSDVVPAEFCQAVADLLRNARSNSYRAVNFIMVEAYWNVGRMIVEEEQQGKERAGYGKALIRDLSERLTLEFGSGFGVSNLAYFRQFYLSFPIFHSLRGISAEGKLAIEGQQAIRYALRNELTWTHYRALMRIDKQEAREWW